MSQTRRGPFVRCDKCGRAIDTEHEYLYAEERGGHLVGQWCQSCEEGLQESIARIVEIGRREAQRQRKAQAFLEWAASHRDDLPVIPLEALSREKLYEDSTANEYSVCRNRRVERLRELCATWGCEANAEPGDRFCARCREEKDGEPCSFLEEHPTAFLIISVIVTSVVFVVGIRLAEMLR